MNVLFSGANRFFSKLIKHEILWNTCSSYSGSFMVDAGVLFSNIKTPLSNV